MAGDPLALAVLGRGLVEHLVVVALHAGLRLQPAQLAGPGGELGIGEAELEPAGSAGEMTTLLSLYMAPRRTAARLVPSWQIVTVVTDPAKKRAMAETIPDVIAPASLADSFEVMTRAVFQAGVSWKQIAAPWDASRAAFASFDGQINSFSSSAVVSDVANITVGYLPWGMRPSRGTIQSTIEIVAGTWSRR